MNSSASESGLMTTRLSIMMFLQFFAWGAWFATLGLAMTNRNLGAFIGSAYESAPIAAIIAPLFLGLIADRLFNSERVFGVLMLIGGVIMLALPTLGSQATDFADQALAALKADGSLSGDALDEAFTTEQMTNNSSGKLFGWMILAYMLCYMPTLGLGNTIAFSHIPSQDKFPLIRVWGTIGWIVAGLLIGITGWDGQYTIFTLGGISSLALGFYCFFLPATPPPLKDQPMNLRSLFMVDAFRLLGDWNFLVFAVCSTLICIPLAYYYGSTSQFLGAVGFEAPGATMTLGQMSEILFMVLIPFFFRRLGVKVMILVGMMAWVVRYLLFSMGAPDQLTWMLLLAVVLHGICYDFFFVTGFMYTDYKAPKEIRGQAQGLLVFLTQGVGMFFGYRIMAAGSLFGIPLDFTIGKYGEQVTSLRAYTDSVQELAGEQEPVSFLEKFGQMFSRSLPEGLDPVLLSETMGQWQNFWMFPAILAGVVFILFGVLFWDRMDTSANDEEKADEPAGAPD